MSELLRRITRQISPYHNPEGITFDKGRLFGETRRKSQATPKQMPDVLALALVEKLGDELKQDVEHIERPVVTRRKPRKPKNEADDKGKSRARLTKSKVAALVHEASAVQESMYKKV